MAAVVIEIQGPTCENVMFSPTGERLRGRWSHVVTAGFQLHEALADLMRAAPEIPGIHVVLDPEKRTARIYDPLKETDEGRAIWAKADPVIGEWPALFGGLRRPWDAVDYPGMSVDDLKTWAYEMRNLLDCGLARHVSGPQLPPLKKIRQFQGARLERSYMSQTQQKRVDVVEAPAATAAATAAAAGVTA